MDDFLPILTLGMYVMIPLTVSWSYNKLGTRNSASITHIITFLLVIIYPHIVWGIRDFENPLEDQCGTSEYFGNIINILIMVPLTQWLQYSFNKQYKNYEYKDQEDIKDK